ncbi:MAG: sarcosine oxidase subunit delta [Pseudomonadota bacterium]
MLIDHPLLGPRDAREFTYLGSAERLARPDVARDDADAITRFHDYVYLRENPAGPHRELWLHAHGDRSLLIVTRDTRTHDVLSVELAREAGTAETESEVRP